VARLADPMDVVQCKFDVQPRDRYSQLLAYVYPPDARMLNEEMVRAGYADLMKDPPDLKY